MVYNVGMNTPENTTAQVTPSQAGSRLLSRFSDTDTLFVRPSTTQPPVDTKSYAIPLERFQQLEQEIRFAPANSGPYVELGQIYLGQQRWTDARRVLDAGVQFCPDCEALVLMREDLMLLLASQLVDAAKTNVAQNPSDATRYELEQAEISFANERIRVCRDRFTRHPEQKEILITWAIALRQLIRHEEAIALLNDAAKDPQLRARASLQLGMCYQTLDRPLEALAAFRKSAMYRSPAPEQKIKQRALELAMDLAEENGLIDSARFYAKQLVDCCDSSNRSTYEKKLKALEATEI